METESQQTQETVETTGVSEDQSQAEATERTLTQEEVNKIVADRVERERKKFERKFENIDVTRYNELLEAEEARKVEGQKRRGEFDNILKETVTKKDTVIQTLQQELHTIKVDGAMLNIASQARAINPQQVVSLVKDQVRMTDSGEVEVIDSNGTTRYGDSGDPMTMSDLVNEFLQQNPHFVTATPRGSGTTSNVRENNTGQPLDLTTLDFKNPEHVRAYREYRKTAPGIAR